MKLEHNRRRIFYINVKNIPEEEIAEFIKKAQEQISSQSNSPLSRHRQQKSRR